jgi:carboxylesterase
MRTYDRHPLRGVVALHQAGIRLRSRVAGLTLPMLILHGKKDRVCPASNAKWLAERVGTRDVTVRVYERSAHVVAADYDRAAVAEDVIAFVRRFA